MNTEAALLSAICKNKDIATVLTDNVDEIFISHRDVWESLYQPINLLFIDELVDSGMDSSGVENALAILKKMSRESKKSIWLVSHKDELAGRVNNMLTVVKENGFTSYNTDVEIV